jgi:hypothetical protein
MRMEHRIDREGGKPRQAGPFDAQRTRERRQHGRGPGEPVAVLLGTHEAVTAVHATTASHAGDREPAVSSSAS